MKKIIATALLFAAGTTLNAHAAFISGNQTLTNGKTVALQGLEWMPLTHTAGFSRNYVSSATGWTDRFNNSWSASDWRYATREETETLINSLWDGVYNEWSKENAIGALWFINAFGGLAHDTGYGPSRVDNKSSAFNWQNYDYTNFLFGAPNECAAEPGSACVGRVAAGDSYQLSISSYNIKQAAFMQAYQANDGALGFFSEALGGNFGISTDNLFELGTYSNDIAGSLLVRTAPLPPQKVSVPGSLGVLSLGLLALVAARRSKGAR